MMKNSNISKIIKENINKVISEAVLKSYPRLGFGNIGGVSIQDRMENLGFVKCATNAGYDSGRLVYRIPLKMWTDEIEKQLQTILNFYGYFLVSKNKGIYISNEYPCVYVTIETIYGNQEETLDTYYHAASTKKVPKILRQGLIPKSSDPMRKNAPSRIYLCKELNEVLFHAVRNGDDYKIFKVDLSSIKNKIKVYTDNLASEDSVYTYDYIPPQCLSIVEKPSDIRKKYISKIKQLIDYKICSKINGLKTIDNKLVGNFENKGTNVEIQVYFGELAGYYRFDISDPKSTLGMVGYKKITYPNGRHRTVTLGKNFLQEKIPNKLLAAQDMNIMVDYLYEKMVKYLFKWLLS